MGLFTGLLKAATATAKLPISGFRDALAPFEGGRWKRETYTGESVRELAEGLDAAFDPRERRSRRGRR